MATNLKQQIEIECQQVQDQLLKLTTDRENLQREFHQITSSSLNLLQQIKNDAQSNSTTKSKFETEKEKLEQKLKALEIDILDKDQRIEYLDSKASEYLLQVSTLSNSLYDNDYDTKGSEAVEGNIVDVKEEKQEAALLKSKDISVDETNTFPDKIDVKVEEQEPALPEATDIGKTNSLLNKNETFESELEPTTFDSCQLEPDNISCDQEIISCDQEIISCDQEIVSCDQEIVSCDQEIVSCDQEIVSDTSADNDVNLNVEVKTVINLVMEEIPAVDKGSNEGAGMSDACNKAILATNQMIENIQEKIESNDMSEALSSVEDKVDNLLPATNYVDKALLSGVDDAQPLPDGNDDSEIKVNGVENTNNDQIKETPKESEMKVEIVKRAGEEAPSDNEVAVKDFNNEPTVRPTPAHLVIDLPSANSDSGKQSNGSGSPVREQMMSLSLLVAELRRVKDDMGKCMSLKEQSFIELEDQLQSANTEVSALKLSMARMSKNLEEKEQSYQVLEEENKKKRMDIELKMKEVQDVTNQCTMLSEEKSDVLRKMEVLEIMMTEYRTEIEMLISEKAQLEEDTKQLLSAKNAAAVAEAEIDSRTNVEEKEKEIEELVEKIQSMEKQMKELNDKLKVTNKHLKVMAREREHKQRECEVLKRKVELVELKMCELQGTFDMLVKAVMVERDELIKEMEEKNGQIDDVHRTLSHLKESHEQELEKVLNDKKAVDDELRQYKSGELKSVAVTEQKELEVITLEKQKISKELEEQMKQKEVMETKIKSIQEEMNDFVGVLKDEMSRMKEESERTKLEKKSVEDVFAALQADHKDIVTKHQSMEKSFQELEQSNKEKSANLEVLKLQLEDLQQQLEDLNSKNFNLSSEMYSKEEEFREELTAREGTIQELNVTLTNNQKQSQENYNALQEDLAIIQTKYKTSVEENKKQVSEIENKLKQSQEEKRKEIAELQEQIKYLVQELKDSKTDLTGSQTSCYQECESPSMSQEAELQSSSLAVVPSLPLDTVADTSSTSHSLRTEAESREADELRKREKELEQELKVVSKKLEDKEIEMRTLVECDIPQLNEKIKQLTEEVKSLRSKEPGDEAFKSQAEFESVIVKKEDKIKELDSKVNDLETCIANKNGYISQLEGRLTVTGGSEVKSDNVSSEVRFDLLTPIDKIHKLCADISNLKVELKDSHTHCDNLKLNVSKLEHEKQNLEHEKTKIVEEYESKLQQASSTLEEVSSNLEEKKNSVEQLELELRKSRNSHVETVASLESNHIDRVAEVVKLHQRKVDELKCLNLAKISELHEHIDELYKAKKLLESRINDKQHNFNEHSSKSEELLAEERKEKLDLMKQIKSLDSENKSLIEETKILRNGFEKEQMMTADMQDQMVSDLERLILGLEGEKKDMEKEISQLKSMRDLQSNIILDNEKKISILSDEIVIVNKENGILKDETKKLKGLMSGEIVSKHEEDHEKSRTIEDLTEKVKSLQGKLDDALVHNQEQEDVYNHKLREEKDDHIMQLRALRKEMSQEVDDIELKRKQLSLDYEDKIALMAADYQDNLKETIKRYETRLAEEKAEFGHVLVTKIDEYERKMASQATDVSSYESQLNALQEELGNKSGIIEDLEQNLDEMTLIKAALRAQVDDLKHTVTKMGEAGDKSSLDVLHAEYESRLNEIQEHYESQLVNLRSVLQGIDIGLQAEGTNEAQRECCSSPSLCSEYSLELSCLRPYLQGQSSPITDLMAEHRCQSSHGIDMDHVDHSFHFLARSASAAKSKEDGKVGITLAGLSAHLLAKSLPKGAAEHMSNGPVTYTLTKSASKSEVKSKLANMNIPLNSKLQREGHQLSSETTNHARLSVPSIKFPEGSSLANSSSSSLSPEALAASVTGARPRPPRRSVSKMRSSPAIDLYAVNKEGTESANCHSIPQPADSNPNCTATPHKYRINSGVSSACCVVQ